jgi:hypothetical protein
VRSPYCYVEIAASLNLTDKADRLSLRPPSSSKAVGGQNDLSRVPNSDYGCLRNNRVASQEQPDQPEWIRERSNGSSLAGSIDLDTGAMAYSLKSLDIDIKQRRKDLVPFVRPSLFG